MKELFDTLFNAQIKKMNLGMEHSVLENPTSENIMLLEKNNWEFVASWNQRITNVRGSVFKIYKRRINRV
jgi:hypothetical protein